MWHSDVIGLVASTVAHEMGHNFGMEHDTDDCDCPDDRCIMAPASSTSKPSFWSSCSLEYLALAFERGMDYCLRNRPASLFGSPICGNGFVEKGEECDCGLRNHCDNPCCDPDTCRLYANATCATGECCDFTTCRPKRPGEMCRLSDHECDLPEFCTGESEFCPKDIYKVRCSSARFEQFCKTSIYFTQRVQVQFQPFFVCSVLKHSSFLYCLTQSLLNRSFNFKLFKDLD